MRTLIAIGCVVLWCPLALAQSPSDAAKILQEFGSAGVLKADGMKTYIRSVEFKKLDTNKSGLIEFDEYIASHLYARLPDCDARRTQETWLEENLAGPLDATRLYGRNPAWAAHVDETAKSHWTLASPNGEAITEAGVTAYLRSERARRDRIPNPAERLQRLTNGQTSDVTAAQFETFFTAEWFDKVDSDHSGAASFLEFVRAVKFDGAPREFCALATDDWLIERSVLSDPAQMNKAPILQLQLAQTAIKLRQAISPLPRVPVDVVSGAFEREAKVAAGRAELALLSPHGFVPGRGLLLAGTRELNDAKEVSWRQNAPATFLRIIKDFTVDDPLKAEPALITIAGERGKETTFALDSTFQLDFYPASFSFFRAAAGVDVERQTGAGGSNVQTYYGTVHLFLWHRGWLESSYVRMSPYVEDDRTKKTTTLAGDVIWQPGLRFGTFSTNQWRSIGSGGQAQWYVTPRFAVELGDTLRAPDDAASVDVTNVRFEILAGLGIGPRFRVTYAGLRRVGLGDADDSGYHEVSGRWSLDEHDRFSFKASVADGRKRTTADSKGTFSFGIGVKF